MKYSWLQSGSYGGVQASRFTLEYLCLMPQNVQDLDVGQLDLFLRSLNEKYTRRLQNFTNASCSRKSAINVCFHKPVLSLAGPSFLTGAIIETRFQASLLTPPGVNYISGRDTIQSRSHANGKRFSLW